MRVGGRDDGFERQRINHLLERVFLPLDLLVLFELEELLPLGIVLISWVEDIGFGNPLAVKIFVPGGDSHFGLAEDEQEEPVLLTPFGCCKMFSEG